MITLETLGKFTWNFGNKFFIETSEGNYVWSDPDYNGDNVINKYDGEYKDWIKDEAIPYGRDKGYHTILEYCGNEVIFN